MSSFGSQRVGQWQGRGPPHEGPSPPFGRVSVSSYGVRLTSHDTTRLTVYKTDTGTHSVRGLGVPCVPSEYFHHREWERTHISFTMRFRVKYKGRDVLMGTVSSVSSYMTE